jgi:hypothetical protein
MAIFWVFAEGLIVLFIRRGYLFIKTGDSAQKTVCYVSATVFIIIACLPFVKLMHLDRLPVLNDLFGLRLYHKYLWSFYCTIWVALEGAALIYVLKTYLLLRDAFGKNSPLLHETIKYSQVLFFVILLAVFAGYHFYIESFIANNFVTSVYIKNIFTLYVKICGIFWVIIEWLIGFGCLKIFFLLKRKSHEFSPA